MPLNSKFGTIAVLCLCFLACNDEFIYNGSDAEPSVVLEGRASAGKQVEVHLTESKQAFDSDSGVVSINGADIRVYVNGSLRGLLIEEGEGHYRSDFIVNAGDSLYLAARRSGKRTVETRGSIPDSVGLLKIDTSDLQGALLTYFMDISHEATLNAYCLLVSSIHYEYILDNQDQITDSILTSRSIAISSANKIFYSERSLISSRNDFQIFTSEFMNTQPYELDLIIDREEILANEQHGESLALIFDLRAIDQGEYRTLESILVNNEVFGGPFGNKNNVNDNIDGGFGLMRYDVARRDTLFFP